jgi:hypothetical protein
MEHEDVPRNLLTNSRILSEDYWLRRARMTRNKAAAIAYDPKLRQRLQRVALEYERLAAYAVEKSGQPSEANPDDEKLSFAI